MNEYKKFLTQRAGYFRNKAKLSTRELSQRMGFSEGYISKFEMGLLNMPSEVLLDMLKILNVSAEEFFCEDLEHYEQNKELIKDFETLSADQQASIKVLIKSMTKN